MLGSTADTDDNGAEWTVKQTAELGSGMMRPGEELPAGTIATLVFRRLSGGAPRIVSVDTTSWHEHEVLDRAFKASTETRE